MGWLCIERKPLTAHSPSGIRRLGVTSLPPLTGVCIAALSAGGPLLGAFELVEAEQGELAGDHP